MSAIRLLGLIFVLALICDKGRTELVIPIFGQDQVPQANQNSFSIEIPLGNGNVIQADNNVQSTVQRRLSLEDFFLNKNQQEQQPSPPAVQEPVTQFQVKQSDPNSLLLVRDAQFPSPTGGLISRMLLARRMLRLRRIARRLTIIPRLFGLGLRQTLQRSAVNPLSLFSNRVGETYDPREFVFGNKGFSYQNNETSNVQQRDANSDQLQQQTRGYAVEADPYYGDVRDNNFDDNSNLRSNNYEDQLRQQQDILNSLTDEQQLLLLQQLQNYQQQLNQLNERLNNQPNNNQVNGQFQQPQQNYQNVQPNQYQLDPHDDQHNNQLNDDQLEQVRQLHAQLLREQQLQQQLQQLQLNQQAQNLRQHQNLASIEQNSNFQEHNHNQLIHEQNAQQHDDGGVGDRTEGGGYPSQIGIGNSAGGSLGGGVGINVGIKPPAVDIQVTKPGISGIKPFPPIVNPIVHKPVQQAPVAQPLVPLGIFPKPILNLKGRLFFGAEMGKGAALKTGAKR